MALCIDHVRPPPLPRQTSPPPRAGRPSHLVPRHTHTHMYARPPPPPSLAPLAGTSSCPRISRRATRPTSRSQTRNSHSTSSSRPPEVVVLELCSVSGGGARPHLPTHPHHYHHHQLLCVVVAARPPGLYIRQQRRRGVRACVVCTPPPGAFSAHSACSCRRRTALHGKALQSS